MMTIFNKHFLKAGGLLTAMLVTLLTPGLSWAVPAGSDYFQTDPSSYWRLDGIPIPFQGVDVSGQNYDTVVQRTNAVTVNGGITGLAIQTLQLVDPNYFGVGINLYATLATNQSGLTGGTMNGLAPNTMQINGVTSGSGTFNSYLDFNVDFYSSTALDFSNPTGTGTLVGTSEVMLTALNVAWSSTVTPAGGSSICPPNYIGCHGVIPVLTGNGFNPTPFYETAPEPSIFALFGAGLALFGYSRRKTAIRSKLNAA